MAGEDPLLKSTKAMIRSVVMSVKEGVPATQFIKDFMEFTGESVPFKKLGYSSLQSFIKSIPDVVYGKMVQGTETYFAVADQATQHLQNLIQRQKSNPKKSKALRKGPPMRYPKMHSQGSKTPPSFGGGWRGGFKSGSRPFKNNNKSKSFSRHRPDLGPGAATPKRVWSPILPTPFDSEAISPLTVTIRKTAAADDGERERVIERQGGSSGGRYMAQRALKDVVGQRQQDKKSSKQYELPPRFQRKMNGASASTTTATTTTTTTTRPGAEENVEPPVSTAALPSNLRQWTARMLKDFPQGLWSTRFVVLYSGAFGQEAPPNLIDIVQTWTDIATVELNTVANRYVIYPLSKSMATITEADDAHRELEEENRAATAGRMPWKNFIVPVATLFEEEEDAKVYASNSTDLSDFYLQRADSCAEDITEMVMETEQQVAIPKLSDLQPGVFCAALYSLDESWYRARVLYVKSNTEVYIIFIDYGNLETVPIHNVRCLTEETAAIPAQAINCSMFGIKPFEGEQGWSEQAMAMFHDMMNGKPLDASTISIENGSCVVELWPEGSDASLNEQLYKAKLVDTCLPNPDPPDLKLPERSYLEVVVAFVDLKHCWLRINGKEYSEALEAFEDRLAVQYMEGGGQPGRRLQEDDVCIAQCDLLYHRVKLKEVLDHQANCFFVDHGYTEWFPLDQLVPLDKDINLSIPYQAVWCELMGLEIYMSNPITITELVERSKNKICVAEVIVRDPLKVMLYDTHGADDININEEIARRLVAEGHVMDLGLFCPIEDSPSESSRASSPRPSTGQPVPDTAPVPGEAPVPSETSVPGTTTHVERLESGIEALTLKAVSEANAVRSDAVINAITNAGSAEANSPPSERTSQSSTEVASSQQGGVVVVDSSSSAAAGQLSLAAMSAATPRGDSLNVSYNTWPLPGYAALPDVGVFFAAFVQSVVDPSNFVIVPHIVMASLDDLMRKMNARFNLGFAEGDKSAVQTPTKVPLPQPNHLYMAVYSGTFYRAIYLTTTDNLHHVLLPDYCFHVLIGKEEMFFLPKPFWSLPFTAFRASLSGIKPAAELWRESTKYKFTVQALRKTLMAVIKRVESGGGGAEEGGGDGEVTGQLTKKLILHLVDTSDPDTDVVISELLLATCNGVVSEA